jgi:hypothetical protein
MSSLFKTLKAQIKEEVVRLVQPPQQQYPQQQATYGQYQNQLPYGGGYQPSPQRYQAAPQNYAPPPAAYPQFHQHPSIPEIPRTTQSQPHTQPQPQYQHQYQHLAQPVHPIPLAESCSARKAVLTKYNTFHVLNNAALPRVDPTKQDKSFVLCESCFQDGISLNPSFQSSFEPYQSPDCTVTAIEEAQIPSDRAICDFWLPKVRQAFHTQCLPQNSLQPLITVAREIQALPGCPGNLILDGGETYTSTSIPHCTICSRCFELYLKPTSFGSYFTKQLQGAGQQWCCDIGKDPGYSFNLLKRNLNGSSPDFGSFATGISQRLQIKPCPGDGKTITPGLNGQVRVYALGNPDITFCEECFVDRIALTSFEHFFTPTLINQQTTHCTCDMASGMAKFLLIRALSMNQFELFSQSLTSFARLPKCEGVKGVGEEVVEKQQAELGPSANWYYVNGYPIIEACPGCFQCIIRPLGVERLFTPITRQLKAGVVRTCNFTVGTGGVSTFNPEDFPSTAHYRGFILRHVLDLASESNPTDIQPFTRLCKIFSEAGPPCGANARGFKISNGRKWFGRVAANSNDNNDCTVVLCQECYVDLVEDTSLKPFLGNDLTDAVYAGDTQGQKEAFCQPFSKKSKAVLRQAAEANDFTIFARHWNNRT